MSLRNVIGDLLSKDYDSFREENNIPFSAGRELVEAKNTARQIIENGRENGVSLHARIGQVYKEGETNDVKTVVYLESESENVYRPDIPGVHTQFSPGSIWFQKSGVDYTVIPSRGPHSLTQDAVDTFLGSRRINEGGLDRFYVHHDDVVKQN